jgi:DNA-binding transcriptional ArsR family regulator
MGRQVEYPFAALSNPIRTEILSLISEYEELSVTEIADAVPSVGRAAVSTHLGVLLEAGLVKIRRDGRHNLYSLDKSSAELAVEFLRMLYGDSLMKVAEASSGRKPSTRRTQGSKKTGRVAS